jgi:L-fuconate dehydratase
MSLLHRINTGANGRYVKAMSWRYISDAITKDEALAMLKAKEATKKEREAEVKKRGYPAYTTSVGWLGMSSFLYLKHV